VSPSAEHRNHDGSVDKSLYDGVRRRGLPSAFRILRLGTRIERDLPPLGCNLVRPRSRPLDVDGNLQAARGQASPAIDTITRFRAEIPFGERVLRTRRYYLR